MSALVFTACAADTSQQRSQLDELKAEVRAMREKSSALEHRLERMELERSVVAGRNAPPVTGPAPVAKPLGEIPELTVVKLKPKKEPAPKIDTRKDIVEPSAETLEALVASAQEHPSSSKDRDRDKDDDRKEPMDAELADAMFDAGMSALRTGNIDGGVVKLKSFTDENPRHAKADNALYFAGLGLMSLSEYKDATAIFENLLKQYPAGDAVVDGMLKLAECRMRLHQPQDAKALFTRVVLNYPGTAAATQAEARLASLAK
ncbi:MAG: tetratricopeptide repeat protein [Myxococcaceae bacterium]